MDWWWRSSSSNDQSQNENKSNPQSPPAGPTSKDNDAHAKFQQRDALKSLDMNESPDDEALEEFKAMFAEAQSDGRSQPTTKSRPPAEQLGDEFYEDSIYPSTMSCSNAFDQAFYCSSMGGQFMNVYRYGGLRSCTDLWRQWRFCMRTKGMFGEERKRRIREWNREKHVKYKIGKSSDDVWDMRTEPIPDDYLGKPEKQEDVGEMQDVD